MKKKNAFTLVELSIVLVILGLLVGGVLTGQSLIKAAQIRAITVEYNNYVTAAHTFRDKYFALPGDMTNATSFWGIAAGTGSDATCGAAATTDKKTCNGNGDGKVQTAGGITEPLRFWQHLSNAGLITGNYTGAYTASSPWYATGINIPGSKLNNDTYWWMSNYGYWAATVNTFGASYNNTLSAYSLALGANLRPEEAWNIDTKMDDGKPGTGKAIAYKGDTSFPCTSNFNNISDTNATYNLTNSGLICYFDFANVF